MIDCFSTRIFRHGGYRTEMIRRSFKDVVIGLVVGYIFGVKAFNLTSSLPYCRLLSLRPFPRRPLDSTDRKSMKLCFDLLISNMKTTKC